MFYSSKNKDSIFESKQSANFDLNAPIKNNHIWKNKQ